MCSSSRQVDTFNEVVTHANGQPAVLSIGFHQETAAKFLPRLRSALLEIELRAGMQDLELRYDRMIDAATERVLGTSALSFAA